MAKTIQQMREERAEMGREMRNLHDNWKPENQARFDDLTNRIREIDSAVSREEAVLNAEASEAHRTHRISEERGISTDEAAATLAQEKEIFHTFLRGGEGALTDKQRSYVAERRARVLNTMSTTTPAEGGYLVPTGFAGRLLEALKAFGGMREVSTLESTATGAAINYPTTDDTAEEGEIIAENGSVGEDDPDFGTKSIGAHMYSSKGVAVPFQLLQDSGIDIEAHIISRLARRIARIQNKHFTVGTGVSQPEGVVTASTVGRTAANGQTTSVTFDDILRLIHSVDPAYRDAARLMFHDSTLLALKLLRDGDDRPLWLPGAALKEPDTINGVPFVINQHMPVMAASAKSILFGDFSKYTIRDVMQVLLFRMTDSAYTKKAQVGFLAFARADGKLLDVGGAVKHYANSAT